MFLRSQSLCSGNGTFRRSQNVRDGPERLRQTRTELVGPSPSGSEGWAGGPRFPVKVTNLVQAPEVRQVHRPPCRCLKREGNRPARARARSSRTNPNCKEVLSSGIKVIYGLPEWYDRTMTNLRHRAWLGCDVVGQEQPKVR